MTSADPPGPGRGPPWKALCLCFIVACLPAPASTQEAPAVSLEGPQAWLVTYGPGEIYWQRFGHNAIWIRDRGRGLDHAFNFGFFDFRQEGFLGNFLLGRLNYFSAARPAELEFAEYIDANRAIRAQRLALGPQQVSRLADRLLAAVRPENRHYLYDYYLDNCSTRIRDALDFAFEGALSEALEPHRAEQNFRDHTRRLTTMDFWLYLGLEAGLGRPVDRPISRWEELFIPGEVAEAMASLRLGPDGGPAVLEDAVLFESSLPLPPDRPRRVWHRYLQLPAALLLAAFLAVRFIPRLASRHLAIAWLLAIALLGLAPAFFWLFTDHWATRPNLNLLLLNPAWLLVAAVPWLRRLGGWLLVAAALIAAAFAIVPGGQYNADVVAAVAALNLAAGWRLSGLRSGAELGQ